MGVKDGGLKQRSIYVYFPSVDMAKKWKMLAEKAETSISKFVIEQVEDSLRERVKKDAFRGELIEQLRARIEKYFEAFS